METFLQDEVKFNLQKLMKVDGMNKLMAMEKALNAVLHLRRNQRQISDFSERGF